jgi:carbon storage regulator CsrA
MGMLCLTRHVNDTIIVEGAGRAVIRLLSIQGTKVRIGVDADPNMVIARGEIEWKFPFARDKGNPTHNLPPPLSRGGHEGRDDGS